MLDFSGQIAVITGGARGIGLASATRLHEAGAKIVIWDQDADLAASVAQRFDGHAFGVDVADAASVAKAVDDTQSQAGSIDVLVNSAGIAGVNTTVVDYAPAEWSRVLEINLTGTFLVNRAVVPGMTDRGYGRIVNIASIAGKEGNPNACAYSASKAGVIALTKSLGKELAGHDIAVNCVTPAAAQTKILEQSTQEHIDYMLSKIPRGRFVTVDEIADMVLWVGSKENSFTTGAVFDISGGRATY